MKRYLNNSTGWYDIGANYLYDADGNIFWSSPIEKLVSAPLLNHDVTCDDSC